jgi:AsmA protein
LDWFHVASSRVPSDIEASGTLTGTLSYRPGSTDPTPWQGEMRITDANLVNPRVGQTSLITGDVTIQSVPPAPSDPRHKRRPVLPTPSGFILSPVSLSLGGKDPATLEAQIDITGYTLHLTGMASIARLRALAMALPQLGDGLAEVLPTNRAAGPFRIDLTATRPWGAPQVWTDNNAHPTPPRTRTRPRS